IFTPALGSIFGRKAGVDEHHLAEIEKSERGDPREMSGFMGWYARSLWQLGAAPTRTFAATFLIVAVIVVWFGSSTHRTEFFLEEDPEWASVYVKARGNLSPEAHDVIVRQVEQRLLQDRRVSTSTLPPGSGATTAPAAAAAARPTTRSAGCRWTSWSSRSAMSSVCAAPTSSSRSARL
ncbi:MAG: hypothetical protein LRY54_01530, partial [Alphaproteobacteria bacterium]|nr:hypothetical protein [Alphaproteobacteria bacterium]